MVDSVAVWPPGFRVTDANDDPVPGAYVEFYDAGTSDAQIVYSDDDLTAALGTTVYCDSAGAPVASSGSSTKITVYVSDQPYKIVIKDSDGNTLETKDNVRGALDTAAFEAGDVSLPKMPVISKTGSYTILTTDQSKCINFDASSATLTATLPSAVTAGDGWMITIRHVGTSTSYRVQVATVSSQTIAIPLAGGAATAFEMTSYGETITLVSDGANWHCAGGVMGLMLGSGYHAVVYDIGTQSSGTLTVDAEEGNLQKLINGGAFTLGVPAEDCSLIVKVTNNASAGTITTSAFDKVDGDTLTTSNGNKFWLYITVLDSNSSLTVKALQ